MKYSLIIITLVSLCYAQPAEIVPTLATLVATYRANGTLQINCTSDTTVSGPLNINSVLTDPSTGAAVGTYTGPFTNTNDGSSTRVVAPNINPTPSLNPGNLANFLGVAQRVDGTRVFDRIVFITRYDTVGGVINATTCAGNTGNLTTVPFQATYGFYRSAIPPTTATLKNTFRATGTLRITCTNGNYSGPSGIDSVLRTVDGTNNQIGIYNGSFVSTSDGSATRTSGTPTSTNNSFGRSLAYFLASAVTVPGTRTFDNIGQITRYDTVGGVANSTTPACTSANEGSVVVVPFEATYGFYSADTTSTTASTTSVRGSAGSLVASVAVVIALLAIAI